MEKRQILGAGITQATPEEMRQHIVELAGAGQSAYVCISNVHMVVEARSNPDLKRAMQESAMNTPDGKPLAVSMRLLYGAKQDRVAGPDLMVELFRLAEQVHLPVFFYGSSDEVLEAMRERLNAQFPALPIAGMISPPFRTLSPEEEQQYLDAINQSGARLVFVGLGCPKQEIWMHRNQGRVQAVMIGVGAAFPFFTGHLKRAPRWMQEACLEWFYRLWMEPRRLLKRYFVTNSLFLLLFHLQWLRQRFGNWRARFSHAETY